MSDESLVARLDAVCEGVTEGPWTFHWDGKQKVDAPDGKRIVSWASDEDSRFIAAARSLIPEAAAALRERDAEIERLCEANTAWEQGWKDGAGHVDESLMPVCREYRRERDAALDTVRTLRAALEELAAWWDQTDTPSPSTIAMMNRAARVLSDTDTKEGSDG